ncbi:fimbria/pilus periplasmic chaperone [Novosphingobium marinum]|nr:fimbria/pilus periplasmic chaperone [Novosphingobium marinum]
MRVSPMVIEMESRGSDSVARVEVQNVNEGNLAFEARILRMEIDESGKIVETPADDQFLVFPPQGVLPAGGRQVVRLQWVGDPTLAASQAYYVSINQLPVKLAPGTTESVAAQVQVLYHMRALAVVAPPGAKPDVETTLVRSVLVELPTKEGEEARPPVNVVEIRLKNSGRRHAMMSNFGWRLEGFDANGDPLRVDVSAEELNQAVGTGYVPALGERTFLLPVSGFGPQPMRLLFTQ